MDRLKQFATKHPLIFAFTITLFFTLMLFVSAMLGTLWPGEETYGQPGGIVGRVISIMILLAALSRLGWLRTAGFATQGPSRTWLILLLPLAYSIVATAYALTGNIVFRLSGLTGFVTLFILAAVFMEEIAFRGLILHALTRAWGNTNRGLVLSVLVSALFFGALHVLDFLGGRPLPNVLLQSLAVFFLGIWLGTLVLNGKSIYPAVFFHGIINLAGYLIFGSKGLEPALEYWLLFSLLTLPLALFGIYLLLRTPKRLTSTDPAIGQEFTAP